MQLLLPVVGPLLYADAHPHDTFFNERGTEFDAREKDLLYMSSAVQLAGLAMIGASLALGTREPVEKRKAGSEPSLYVAPMTASGTIGVTLNVHRW